MATQHDSAGAAHESVAATPRVADWTGAQAVDPVVDPAARPVRLAQPALQARGNAPVRQAAILQLQQTQGNRATRRLLQRLPARSGPAAPVAVQRGPGAAPDDTQVKQAEYDAATPTPLRTIDDLITLVQHVEAGFSEDWTSIVTRIRKAYYDGFLWDSMIKDRENHAGLAWPPLSVQDYKAFTTAKNHPEITVNGDSIDIGHVFTGLDAANFPKTGTVMSAAGVSGPAGATWAGDVGSALAEWDLHAKKGLGHDRTRRQEFYDKFASSDDMLGDVDGIALSAAPAGGAAPAASLASLSGRLRAYYKTTDGAAAGVSKRFTKFAQGSGFPWTGRGGGIVLSETAKDGIRKQIDNFAVQWRRKATLGVPGANWFYAEDIDWFRDKLVAWVHKGLAAENP